MPAVPPHKRPRTSSPPIEDSTDYKLALLTSLHPASTPSILLDLLLSCNGSVPAVTALLTPPPPPPRKPFLHTAPPPRPPKKGETLHLYTPSHISALTPMTLYPSFFPSTTSHQLLHELLHESHTFPPPPPFSLFSRTVTSPHRSCFFLRSSASQDYTYQGGTLPSRPFTPSMEAATAAVEQRVNEKLQSRPRRPGEMKGPWKVNAAIVNCYRGGGESVGWHSDQLTYLGPMAVIASVSLGCKRDFRVGKVAGGGGVYSVGLEHGGLLIMEGGMQEGWKHSIHPATVLDLHPVAGGTSCGFFKWGVFDEYGEPPWSKAYIAPGSEKKQVKEETKDDGENSTTNILEKQTPVKKECTQQDQETAEVKSSQEEDFGSFNVEDFAFDE